MSRTQLTQPSRLSILIILRRAFNQNYLIMRLHPFLLTPDPPSPASSPSSVGPIYLVAGDTNEAGDRA